MKIIFLRRYRENKNLSMKLYADRLKGILLRTREGLRIENFSPKETFSIPGVKRFRFSEKIQDYMMSFVSYPQEIGKLKADIFHIVDHANAYLIDRLNPAKTVITCHDLIILKIMTKKLCLGYEKRDVNRIAAEIFKKSSRRISRAAGLIAGSRATKKDMLSFLPCKEKNIRVIYYPVDKAFRKVYDTVKLHEKRNAIAGNAKYIMLHVGSCASYKNIAGLIRAFKRLVERYGRDIFFIKVGKLKREHLELIRRFNLSKYMRIIPWAEINELNLLYNLADLFIFPSLYEGYGWPVLEAMACETPVVSSDKGGLKEAVEGAAHIVDPYDADSMAKGIIKGLEDKKLRSSLVSKGLDRIKRINCKEIAEKTYQIYQEIYS